TVMRIAGLATPSDLDSNDVVALARQGSDGPREIAICGRQADRDLEGADRAFVTVFDREWYLELTPKLDDCRLTRMGTLEDVAPAHPDIVERLHKAGINEMERRGADPALVQWYRNQGETEFPGDACFWDGYPGPAGFAAYFSRLHRDE
ncbi:unnamed protein product, partial [marine sediment metagenome]